MKKNTSILIVIVLGAVMLRVLVALYLGDIVDAPPLLQDQRSYHALGERLITGHEFSFDRGWYPFTPPDTPTAHWSFLYSLGVASVYAVFGAHPLAARLVQAVLGGILLPLLAYLFSRRLFQSFPARQQTASVETTALITAAVTAIYPYFILYSATIMTETSFMIVLLWSLYLAMGLAQRPTWTGGLFFGLSLGIATLIRQSILPWALVLSLWLLWSALRKGSSRRMLGVLVLSALMVALAILPFTIRNYRMYGQFLLLNSNAGYAMYSAQHPLHGTEFHEFIGIPIPEELKGLNEAQMDRELMQLGIGFVLAEPGRYLQLSLSRIIDFIEFWPTPDTSLLHNVGRVGSLGVMLPFIIIGLVLAVKQSGPKAQGSWLAFSASPLAMVLLFAAVYTVQHVLTWAMPRYRLPVDAVLLSFAALGLHGTGCWLKDRIQRQRTKSFAHERVNDIIG
jgi:4-amino-4-deoxy-L-arabinose transferase-like glycosyltransferase